MMRCATITRGLALFVAACLLPAAGVLAAPFRILVPDAIVPIAPMSVIELADRLGYYKREGVDVEFVRVQATPTAIAALRSGQGDMANVSFDTALQLVARNQMQLQAVVSPDKALPFVIVGKAGIRSPKQLAGKSFGIARIGSADYLETRAVLARLGVAPDSLRYIAVGQPAIRAQALAAGQIDATTVTAGTWSALENRSGLGVVVDSARFYAAAPFITKISVVTAETAKTKAREVQGVVRATILAARDFAAKPELWVDAMARARPDVSRSELMRLAAVYRDQWSVNGGITPQDAVATSKALYQTDDFKDLRPVPPREWINMQFVRAVLQRDGFYRLPGK